MGRVPHKVRAEMLPTVTRLWHHNASSNAARLLTDIHPWPDLRRQSCWVSEKCRGWDPILQMPSLPPRMRCLLMQFLHGKGENAGLACHFINCHHRHPECHTFPCSYCMGNNFAIIDDPIDDAVECSWSRGLGLGKAALAPG